LIEKLAARIATDENLHHSYRELSMRRGARRGS